MRITNFVTKQTKSHITYSADFVFSNEALNKTVWFEVPKSLASSSFPFDSFFVAAYPMAVVLREDLDFLGSVSKRLFYAIPKVIELIALGDYKPLVHIDAIKVRRNVVSATGQLFTLGVDSFFTLVEHDKTTSSVPHYLLFVNGYDILPVSRQLMQKTQREIQKTAKHFQVQALFVRTNLRTLSDKIVDWGRFHGAAMASAGHLCTSVFGSLYFNSSTIHREKIPWGTSKLVDGLWSSEALSCIPFGTATIRVRKVQTIVESRHFDFIKQRLRVCWQNFGQPNAKYNCSRCEKCLRTHVAFQFFTKEKLPTFEPIRIDDLVSFHIKVNDMHHWRALSRYSLQYLGEHSPIYLGIQELLRRNEVYNQQKDSQVERVKSRILNTLRSIKAMLNA